MKSRALCSPVPPGLICLAIAAVSVLPAVYDLWKVVTIAAGQLDGPAAGTDFLNLYTGASLFAHEPGSTYQLDTQQLLQRSLTGRESPLVPFYLPPYAALLVSWLGWLPYGPAYVLWLVVNVVCLMLAIFLAAPRWTRWYVFVWLGLVMPFLPVVLGLGQGQTSALLLLASAGLVRGFTSATRSSISRVTCVVGWLLKPQLGVMLMVVLVLTRSWRILAGTLVAVAALGTAALIRLGQAGIASYVRVSQQKTLEVFTADPTFLIGPTLLHASHWLLGVNAVAHLVAAVLASATIATTVYVWRHGVATDESLLLKLAILPIASVIAAPYALIYELMPWLVSFWLLWDYTALRPSARAVLLWLVAGVWISANIGVGEPRAGGADVAAILGLCFVAYIAGLSYYSEHRDLDGTSARQSICG